MRRVRREMIFSGNFPNVSALMIKAGLVFRISAPMDGSSPISQISPCFIKTFAVKCGESGQLFIVTIVFDRHFGGLFQRQNFPDLFLHICNQ